MRGPALTGDFDVGGTNFCRVRRVAFTKSPPRSTAGISRRQFFQLRIGR
jgi:hypothetical protein